MNQVFKPGEPASVVETGCRVSLRKLRGRTRTYDAQKRPACVCTQNIKVQNFERHPKDLVAVVLPIPNFVILLCETSVSLSQEEHRKRFTFVR